MREAIGGTWLFGLVITFIVFFASFLAVSINYAKAFNVKNEVINIVSKYEGNNNTTRNKIRSYLRNQGYRLLIWDTYRPQKAVSNFVEWINNPQDEGDKTFYPKLKKSDLLKGNYIMEKSGHTRGSTVDLTIIKKDGSFVDMGGTFDLFSEISHPDYKKLTREQKRNRKILHDAMIKAGFKGIDSEWWHFTLKNEPYPDTYFDFDVE